MCSPVLSVQDRAGKTENTNENGKKSGVPLSILIPVVAGFEVLIVAGLVMYYRRWRHRRELYSVAPSDITIQASLNEDSSS